MGSGACISAGFLLLFWYGTKCLAQLVIRMCRLKFHDGPVGDQTLVARYADGFRAPFGAQC